jgi:hypothetical protein
MKDLKASVPNQFLSVRNPPSFSVIEPGKMTKEILADIFAG